MHGQGDIRAFSAQFLCERHDASAPLRAVKDGRFGDGRFQHFLKTEGLCANLHGIGLGMPVRRPLFVFHGIGSPCAAAKPEFHHIRLAADAQAQGAQRQVRHKTNLAARCAFSTVGMLVHEPPLGCVAVFLPDLLQVNQRALPGALGIVLQCGKGHKIRFIHTQNSSVYSFS